MVKKKRKSKDKKHFLYLTCTECGNKFKSERYKKYCTWKCQRLASNRFAKIRYSEMRDIVLKAKGVIE